jgi:hypothetical protein
LFDEASVFQSFVPQAALAAGLPPRYLYWRGRSGRRHLFTRTDLAGVGDFGDAVAILVDDGEIVWAGEASAAACAAGPLGRVGVHVHLLATSAAARRAIAEDLAPAYPRIVRLAA